MPKNILWIFIIGLTLRLSYCVFAPQLEIASDDKGYTMFAHSLAQGKGYRYYDGRPEVHRPPGYSFFLGVIYKIFGFNHKIARAHQAVLSAAVILIVYLLGKKIFDEKTGTIAAAVTSVYPPFIGYSGILMPQALAAFLLPLTILLMVNFRKSFWLALLLGLLAAYNCLVRAEMVLFFIILFPAMVLILKENRKQILKYAGLALLSMFLVILLWTYRNYRIFNKVIFISTQYGDVMWQSTWKEEWLEWQDKEPLVSILAGRDRTEAAGDLFKAALQNIKGHPFIYLKMCAKRLYRLWLTGHSNVFPSMFYDFSYYFQRKEYLVFFAKFFMLVLNLVIELLGLFGMIIAYKRLKQNRRYLSYIAFPILFFVVLYFFTFATPRYAVPIMPFVIMFSSYSIASYFGAARKRRFA